MVDWRSLILIAAVALVVWLWMRRSRSGAGGSEKRLRGICFGDQGQVDRLIHSEMSRAPGISRAEAAGRAVARYERDNH